MQVVLIDADSLPDMAVDSLNHDHDHKSSKLIQFATFMVVVIRQLHLFVGSFKQVELPDDKTSY